MQQGTTPHDEGQPLAVDPNAETAAPDKPAFLAPPPGAPVYHGFPLLHDVVVEGFTLGMISNWESSGADYGDAFVVAPDGGRVGLVWEVSSVAYVKELIPPEPKRWGVWAVGFLVPMGTRDEARANLAQILPSLKPIWEQWSKTGDSRPTA